VTPPLLDLQDLSYTYPGAARPVLDGLDFTFDGRRVGMIGPNGSGKTTVFHCIMGLVRPDAGRVLFRGREVVAEKEFRELRRSVGLLFQNVEDQLFSPTVLEDVAFGPLNLGLDPDHARQRALETLERLGLAGLEDRVTHGLSGGEKKLVALATVLSMRPRALLLDEPTNDLDPDTRARLIDILVQLDCGLVVISHDWDFLSHTIDDVYAMHGGRLHAKARSVLHVHHHVHLGGDVPHEHRGLPHDAHAHDDTSTDDTPADDASDDTDADDIPPDDTGREDTGAR
jgi:cobalt/nickel transport system ATP-binding protein